MYQDIVVLTNFGHSPRPGSPEPPVLVTDDADEDTNPTEPAYVTTGTDTDGVETDNPEDYNPDDLLAAQKAFEQITKTKRDLVERSPVDFRLIKSAIARKSSILNVSIR